jgi:hypothetical protein
MNKEEQWIAIAEACGWKETEPWLNGTRCFEIKGSVAGYALDDIPDYVNDLNAMHEATMSQSARPSFWQPFHQHLWHAVERDRKAHGAGLTTPVDVACATAAQRAEAFLKTIGKWKH